MKKIVILVLSLFLITGCSVQYNVVIDDKTVTETALIFENNDFYSTYYKSSKTNVLNMLVDDYKDILKENSYDYQIIKDGPFVEVKKEYDNVETYLNQSILFNDYFDKITYSKENNKIKIETEGFHPNDQEDPSRFNISSLDIAIKCSYQVTNSNASKVDEKTNTYHFILNDEMEDFKIILEYDVSKKFNPYLKNVLIIIGAVVIALVSWIFVFILNKKKKI